METERQNIENRNLQTFINKRIRFSPSPGGDIHIGHLLILYFNSKLLDSNSKFILRIDDTNKSFNNIWLKEIKSIAKVFNIKFDVVIQQSDRYPLYRNLLYKLPVKYSLGAWIFISHDVIFKDFIRNKILKKNEPQTTVMMKSNKEVTYQLASIVDDVDLMISDIVRANDHIDNSFIHNECFKNFNLDINFWLLPLISNSQGEKMSKSKGNGVVVTELLKSGISSLAIKNYLEDIIQNLINGKRKGGKPLRFDLGSLQKLNKDVFKNIEVTISEVIKSAPFFDFKIYPNKLRECQDLIIQGRYTNLIDCVKECQTLIIKVEEILSLYYSRDLNYIWLKLLDSILELNEEDLDFSIKNLSNEMKFSIRNKLFSLEKSPETKFLIKLIYKKHHGCT